MNEIVSLLVVEIQDYLKESEALTSLLSGQEAIRDVLQNKKSPDAFNLLKAIANGMPNYWAAVVFDTSGNVLAGSDKNGQSLEGENISSLPFFTAAVSSSQGGILMSDTIFRAPKSSDLIFAFSGQLRDEAGNLLGCVALLPDWSGFTAEKIDPIHVGKDGYGLMIDKECRFIAHARKKDVLLKNLGDKAVNDIIFSTKKGIIHYTWDNREKVMSYYMIPETGWTIQMSAYEDDLAATALSQRNVLIMGGVIVVILMTGICLFLIRRFVIQPVNVILSYTTKIAQGDLNASLTGKFKYEFVTLAEKIRVMVAELKNKLGFTQGVLDGMAIPCVIVNPDGTINWMNDQMCELAGCTKKTETYEGITTGELYFGDASKKTTNDKAIQENRVIDTEIDHIFPSGKETTLHITTTPFYDLDGDLLGSTSMIVDLTEIRNQQRLIKQQNERISTAAAEADKISQHLASAAEELSAQVEQASKGAQSQRDRMSETATAMNQMNVSVLEVARNASSAAEVTARARKEAELGAANLEDLIRTIAEVQSQSLELKKSMGNLGDQAQEIGNVMNVITDIADQTNLLALNAAIEAARAGEAGRGFAVVADEVRKLAEKTMAATKEVGNAIAGIQSVANVNIQATDSAVTKVGESTSLAEKSGNGLKSIVALMENAATQVSGIAAAAEEQSSTSEEISRSTEEVNVLSRESSESMGQSAQAVQEVAQMATDLTKVIDMMS